MSVMPDRNDETDVERMLALAGPRDAVPSERLDRMRAAVHHAWTESVPKFQGQTPWHRTRLFFWTLVATAAAAAAVIAIVRTHPGATIAKHADPSARAVEIRTGPAERKSLRLGKGGELRVDASSVVTLTEGGQIDISKGALYLDSKGAALPAVITPAGTITDIGTRFEVRLVDGNTRVRVRDGKVRLAQASTVSEVGASEELVARADESTSRRRVDPFGAQWAWVTRAAPRFDLEGKSLGNFLDWIEHEGGWTVTFASPALERNARSTLLHGSVEHWSTTEALDAILQSCGLAHRVDLKTGRVMVMEEGPGK